MPSVIGIDTGAHGAAVYILDPIIGPRIIDQISFGHKTSTRRAIFAWFSVHWTPAAYIEKVSPHPARGKDGKPRRVGVKSMFTMGMNYERPMMALAAADIKTTEISPKEWQKGLGIVWPKGIEYRERKDFLAEKARELFPDIRITKSSADAFLIAYYARQKERGMI